MSPRYFSAIWAALAPALGNHLWQSTLFALAAGLLTLRLRKNHARARYWLWLAASVKFLIPFAFLVDLGSHLAWSRGSAGTKAGLYLAMEEIGQPFARPVIPAVAHATPSTIFPGLAHLFPALLAAAWLCGFLMVLFVWYARWHRISAVVRGALPLREGREIQALRRLERVAGIGRQIKILVSRASLEPGIFGIARPVLVWPEGISERLADAHLEAILAHELWHVRRRDNLAAAIHMVVEAIFWFYPLVWWLGSRLVDERERACDEEVLDLGGECQVYAESILKVCEFCVGSPLACVSGVTGADLKKRMVHIMTQRVVRKLDFSRKLLLSMAALVAVVLPIVFGLVSATPSRAASQAESVAASAPPFEVVSIKPSTAGGGRVAFGYTPDGLMAKNVSLQLLLREAYEVSDDRISGGPSWVTTDKYDIQVKVNASVTTESQKFTLDNRRVILQPLLADRFQLRAHSETKDLPVYTLVAAQNGPKLQETKFVDGPDGIKGPRSLRVTGKGLVAAQGVPMAILVRLLSEQVGHTVVDKTGLAGAYDFSLQWTPDQSQASQTPMFNLTPAGQQGSSGTSSTPASGPSIFTALQEQLGLELKSQEGPMQVLVIDHVERPAEN
jgi:bla regulator protein BlaR1